MKGLRVIATGDFSHPGWLSELKEKLQPAEHGLYALKKEYGQTMQQEVPRACKNAVRFILSAEISNIYKKGDKVRKVHNVLLSPSLETAEKIQHRLEKIGNIRSDGRPILGLDSRDLLEIVLEEDEDACLIPAHIWTPWFSALGSKSGFDSIEECYGDLSEHIFAVETGLSSDPSMNWRVSSLDKYTLVSNSDAHSPQKLAREANLFNCDLSYHDMVNALKSGDPSLFGGTIEFYPEEGKYHFDGHRKCGIRLSPAETRENKGICPVCGKKVTLGVSYRVEVLADRVSGMKHDRALPFISLIPLDEIVAEVSNCGVTTKTVATKLDHLLSKLGPELDILRSIPLTDIERAGGLMLREAIERMRNGKVHIDAGYDGEFGVVRIFSNEEREQYVSKSFFVEEDIVAQNSATNVDLRKRIKKSVAPKEDVRNDDETVTAEINKRMAGKVADELLPFGLNKDQLEAVETSDSHLLIIAGPGTGKTHTLTYRIFYLISELGVAPQTILAVTFTNKAAAEMKQRLTKLVGIEKSSEITIKTFHSLGATILREHCSLTGRGANFSIFNDNDRKTVIQTLLDSADAGKTNEYLNEIAGIKNNLQDLEELKERGKLYRLFTRYDETLNLSNAFDYDDLIYRSYLLLKQHPEIAEIYQRRFRWISIDEYQDINYAQYALIMKLISEATNVCAIGDPDQAIYGFRGSDYHYFLQFVQDFNNAQVVHLTRNYRSTQSILDASDQIITKSSDHDVEHKLWSENIQEGKLEIFRTPTDKSEAETIVHKIEELIGATSFFSMDSGRVDGTAPIQEVGFGDIAVFYRLHAQLPLLEEAFLRAGIPYQAYGSVPFWEIKEVREIVSYLRVLVNPQSDLDLYRVLLNPPRGIAEQTIQSLLRYRTLNKISLWEAINKVHLISSLSETHRNPIITFRDKLKSQLESYHDLSLAEIIEDVLTVFGLKTHFKNDEKRIYYWDKLLQQARTIQKSVEEFLEDLSLQVETDYYDPRAEKVSLMSMHAAKGLEFPIVFIAGCEDGLIPFIKKDSRNSDLDEERRLFYVAMTRSKSKLFLMYSASRFLFGEHRSNIPSRFLSDIEEKLKEYRRAQLRKKKMDGQGKEDNGQLSLF